MCTLWPHATVFTVCERSVSWKVLENTFFESWKALEFDLKLQVLGSSGKQCFNVCMNPVFVKTAIFFDMSCMTGKVQQKYCEGLTRWLSRGAAVEWSAIQTASSATSCTAEWLREGLCTDACVTTAITEDDSAVIRYDCNVTDGVIVTSCSRDCWSPRWRWLVWHRSQHLSTVWYQVGCYLWTSDSQVCTTQFLSQYYYTVSQKNDTNVTHYRFNPHQPISVIFGRDVAERVCYWMVIYYPTSPN